MLKLILARKMKRFVRCSMGEQLIVSWCPQGDSNARTRLRRPVLYPLSYGGQRGIATHG